MPNTDSLVLHNVESIDQIPGARIVLTDSKSDGEAAKALFPRNPVVWVEGGSSGFPRYDLRPLHERDVVYWSGLPILDAMPIDWVRKHVARAAKSVSVVLPPQEQAEGPEWVQATGARKDAIGWAASHLRPLSEIPEPPPRQGAETRTQRRPSRPTLATVDGAPVDGSAALDPDDAPLFTPLAEDTLARIFTAENPGFRYVAAWGKWLSWDGGQWREDSTLSVYDLARNVCVREADKHVGMKGLDGAIRRAKSAQCRAAVENLARSDRAHAATAAQWDADPWALNTPSGVVDLTNGTIRPARMDDYMARITAVGPGGECPRWLQFLHDVTAGDAELIGFLQRMAGYSLTGITREHALFFAYGSGGNGKGTFLNTLSHILGDYAKTASMETFTESKTDRHPQELASLMGRRMVTAQETERGRRWAESRIKALTGGDPITARFMRQDEFTFDPQFKLIIAGNHKPGLRSVDEAIRRRLHLIPFTVTMDEARKDVRLPEKLRQEGPGILAWAIQGCLDWQTHGLRAPESVKAATGDYLDNEDAILSWMNDCCERQGNCKTTTLYESYRQWAKASGEYELSQKLFSQELESKGIQIGKSHGVQTARGLSLKISDERYYYDD